jgi:hypothetical protein
VARRALAAAALAAVTLTTTTLVLDDDRTPVDTWAAQLGYGAPLVSPTPEDDEERARPIVRKVSSSTRAQSGGPNAVQVPVLDVDLLPPPDETPEPTQDPTTEQPRPRSEPTGPLGKLLFSSGFEDGTLDGWGTHESGPIEIVDHPTREGNRAVRLTAQDGDGGNVRTQLDGPVLFDEGDEAYVGWSTYFPGDMPEIPSDSWFVFFEFHGPPHNGSPLPGAFAVADIDGRQHLKLGRSEQYGYDVPWTMPMVKDRWVDFVYRVKFSKDEEVGFVELWVDGVRQEFSNGSTRLYQSTIMSDQDDGLYPIATNYYEAGTIDEPVTVYHDAIRVATTYGGARPAAG